jgi:hypothetical protein
LWLIALDEKQIIPSCLPQRCTKTPLAIQGISRQHFAFPVDVLDQAASHRQFALLLLCFWLLRLFGVPGLASDFHIVFFHMSLVQHDPQVMSDQTDRMDGIALLLFKRKPPFVRFSIN